MRSILHEAQIDKRVQYMVEVVFANRKDGFKDYPSVIQELDLVEESDQFTHMMTLEENYQDENVLSKLTWMESFGWTEWLEHETTVERWWDLSPAPARTTYYAFGLLVCPVIVDTRWKSTHVLENRWCIMYATCFEYYFAHNYVIWPVWRCTTRIDGVCNIICKGSDPICMGIWGSPLSQETNTFCMNDIYGVTWKTVTICEGFYWSPAFLTGWSSHDVSMSFLSEKV